MWYVKVKVGKAMPAWYSFVRLGAASPGRGVHCSVIRHQWTELWNRRMNAPCKIVRVMYKCNGADPL